MAHAAIERALDAIPPPWLKLRHLLAQTYFMPFALTCIALLSRVRQLITKEASLLTPIWQSDGMARLGPKLGGGGGRWNSSQAARRGAGALALVTRAGARLGKQAPQV